MRDISINITSHATEIDVHHVWTDDDGNTHGSLNLGDSWMAFHDPQQARKVAAALGELASSMEAEAGRYAALCAECRENPICQQGQAGVNGQFRQACLDNCHDSEIADRCCPIDQAAEAGQDGAR